MIHRPSFGTVVLLTVLCSFGTLRASSFADLQAAPAKILSSDRSAIRLGFDGDQMQVGRVEQNGEEFEIRSIPEEGTTYEFGKPVLPAVSRFVVVPPNAGLSFSYEAGTPRIIHPDAPLALCVDTTVFHRDNAPLEGLYPGVLAEMSEPFIIRGARIVKVTVYPLQYDPATNTYLQYDHINPSIEYTNDEPVNPVTMPVRRNRSRVFLQAIRQMVINGDEVGRDDPPDSEPPYIGHYLAVVHANAMYPELRNFLEFRRKTGYKVDIYMVPANDAGNPQSVKNGILARYNAYLNAGSDPFDYVMICGDIQYDRPADHGASNVILPFRGQSVWGQNGPDHADYLFACLEGGNGDEHPDVGFSRMPAGSPGAAGLIYGRQMAYIATPRMANPEWFTRGGALSTHWGNGAETAYHISINTNVRWGEEVLKSVGFRDVRFFEDYEYDQQASRAGPEINRWYNAGTNVIIARLENYHWANNGGFSGVEVNTVFPIEIAYSGHGEWALQIGYRTGSAQSLRGPVLRTCGWGWPATAPMNYVWLKMVNGLLQQDLPAGWARMLAVNQIEGVFPNFQVYNGVNLYPHIKTDADMYGDPGLQPWLGVPRRPEIELPATVSPATRSLEVFVHGLDSDEPMPGARVTLYSPGNIPAVNQPAEYAAYNNFFMLTTLADENGIARFVLNDRQAFVNNKPFYVTASGRDIRAFTDTVNAAAVPSALEVSSWTMAERDGNGDEEINPGETIEVMITAINPGTRDDLGDVEAEIQSLSPWVDVVENNAVAFGNVAHGEEVEANAPVTLLFHPETPDGGSRPMQKPVIRITFRSGEAVWISQIEFTPLAPNFELSSVIGGNIVADDLQDLVVELDNIGAVTSPALDVELRSLGLGVTVIENTSSLPEIESGESARIETPFTIGANSVVVPGSKTMMLLIFRSGGVVVDSAKFELQVMRERENAPTGPDKYGYICFDDTDDDWDMAPVYEWIEINPNIQEAIYEGELADSLTNGSPEVGKCRVLDLGFTTQFYGREYTQITVANNGFIAMGRQPRITNPYCWPMDQAIAGGVGMLAPFWDDLRIVANTSTIWSYYDEDNGRFIVQWDRLRHPNGNADLTFQVILYDKDVWITESGDPNILFQYKTITNAANFRQGDDEWVDAINYASVGISSPDGTTGINYSYLNRQPVSGAPIANRRALLFSTSPRYKACTLMGSVTDALTGMPIEGARVFTEQGFIAITDADGYWQILDALAEVPFDISVHKQGYNDSTLVDQEVLEDSTAQYDFALLHPEFSPSVMELGTLLDPDRSRQLGFNIVNSGNGPLYWTAEKRLIGDANASPWEVRRRIQAGSNLEDDRIEGVVFAEDKFFLSGANVSADLEDNLIYILNRDGELVDSFYQTNSTRWGYKDIDYDGQFIWAAGSGSIYALTLDGQVAITFDDPLAPTEKIACDRENSLLYLSGTTTDIVRVDYDGNLIGGRLDRRGLRIYGLAWWPEDPDGHNLYVVNSPGGGFSDVHKMNTEDGDTMGVFRFAVDTTGSQQSAWITNEYDVYSWVMMTIQNLSTQRGGDRLEIHQLDARKDWMDLDVWDGMLNTQETQEFVLTLDATGLPDTLFQGELFFRHNADTGSTIIDISLDVIGPERPIPFDLLTPTNNDTITALPLHGDTLDMPSMVFNWNRSFDVNFDDTVLTYVFYLRTGGETAMIPVADTTLSLLLDTLDLPLWFDQSPEWWVSVVSRQDTVESTAHFVFHIIANEVDRDKFGVPIEFGLHSIYPSPFNSATTVRFGADKALRTRLSVFDLMGREIAVLFDKTPEIGNYKITWDAGRVPTGLYMIRLESAGRVQVQKVALIR